MNALLSRRALFFSVAVIVFGLVLIYPAVRLLNWLGVDPSTAWLIGLTSFAAVLVTRTIHERIHSMLTRRLTAFTMTWLGISFVAFCLTLVGELWVIGFSATAGVATTVLWILLLLSIYGLYNAQRLHTYVLDINAPACVRGLSMVQISDVHIGSRLPGLLQRIVKQTNALRPDYVLITGDLIDMREITENELAPLADLQAPVLFCTGNHERYVDLEDICERLQNLGVLVLRDSVYCPNNHPGLTFFGIDDQESKTQVASVLPGLAATHPPGDGDFRILLYHRPDGADVASAHRIDLMLTGHTHRGQIIPFNFLVKRVFPQYFRSYQQDYTRLYVSPGTGTWGPTLRLGSKCEITLIRLL